MTNKNHNMDGMTKKECSDFYIPSYPPNNDKFNIDNVLLCQYEMMDTAIFIKNQKSDSKILLHNFANNNKPCDGLWDSNSQENQIYRRTNIKNLILPIQHRLYPIQESYKKDVYNNYSIYMLITENCQLYSTDDGRLLKNPIYIDIVSLPPLIAPQERDLDIYITYDEDNLSRTDYNLQEDKDKTEQKIKFLLNYAIGENYDYLITGIWGIGNFLNPQWGMINLWNKSIMELPNSKLKILFCLPLYSNYNTAENEYNYKYFNRYLLGQNNQFIDFEKKNREKKEKEELSKLSKDEVLIKSKIYGLIWGTALAEINNYYSSERINKNNENNNEKWILLNSDYSIDWDIGIDQTVIMMRSLIESNMNINLKLIAQLLVEWKNNGFIELEGRPNTCNDYIMKHILSQPEYILNPLDTSEKIYKSKGADYTSNIAMARNIINGIFKDYFRRSILCCKLTQPDTACQVGCLIQSFIIRSLWDNKYITSDDLSRISNICFKIFDKDKVNNIQRKCEFDNFWMIARNYQYKMNDGLEQFIMNNLKPNGFRPENSTYMSMAISLILLYDIQGYIKIDGKYIRSMMNAIEISNIDDKLRDKKINYEDYLPDDYYFNTMEIISKCNPDNVFNAVAGSIIGLACHKNVYNDTSIKDEYGNKSESNSQQWIKYATNKEWLNTELNKFIRKYFDIRNITAINNIKN